MEIYEVKTIGNIHVKKSGLDMENKFFRLTISDWTGEQIKVCLTSENQSQRPKSLD